jgi:hypothetical protein
VWETNEREETSKKEKEGITELRLSLTTTIGRRYNAPFPASPKKTNNNTTTTTHGGVSEAKQKKKRSERRRE